MTIKLNSTKFIFLTLLMAVLAALVLAAPGQAMKYKHLEVVKPKNWLHKQLLRFEDYRNLRGNKVYHEYFRKDRKKHGSQFLVDAFKPKGKDALDLHRYDRQVASGYTFVDPKWKGGVKPVYEMGIKLEIPKLIVQNRDVIPVSELVATSKDQNVVGYKPHKFAGLRVFKAKDLLAVKDQEGSGWELIPVGGLRDVQRRAHKITVENPSSSNLFTNETTLDAMFAERSQQLLKKWRIGGGVVGGLALLGTVGGLAGGLAPKGSNSIGSGFNPVISSDAPNAITVSSATITGNVTVTDYDDATAKLEYWENNHPDDKFPTTEISVAKGTAPVPVEFNLTGLNADTNYAARIVVTADGRKVSKAGDTVSFTTGKVIVGEMSVTGSMVIPASRTTDSAEITASVDPNNHQNVQVYVEDFITGKKLSSEDQSVTKKQSVSFTLSGLEDGKEYKVKVIAVDGGSGLASGEVITFTTVSKSEEGPIEPVVITPVPVSPLDPPNGDPRVPEQPGIVGIAQQVIPAPVVAAAGNLQVATTATATTNGQVSVALTCNGNLGQDCAGTIELQQKASKRTKGKRSTNAVRTVGRANFTVKAGGKSAVKVNLSSTAKRELKRTGKLKVTVKTTSSVNKGPATISTHPLTIKTKTSLRPRQARFSPPSGGFKS